MSAEDWLYLRIYPGSLASMDPLLVTVIAPFVEAHGGLPGVERWFFLRYIDQRGLHVRLRFKGSPAALASIEAGLTSLLDRCLLELAASAPAPEARPVPLIWPEFPSGAPGYERDTYEPEYEKYGGTAGVDIAERLFQASSDVALRVLQTDAGPMPQRVALALLLMAVTAEAGVSGEDQAAFWQQYAAYWSGGAAGAAMRAYFESFAAVQAAEMLRLCARLAADGNIRTSLTGYRRALRSACAEAQAAGTGVPSASLSFQYTHLMNNRLGIFPAEEPYLVALGRATNWGRADGNGSAEP